LRGLTRRHPDLYQECLLMDLSASQVVSVWCSPEGADRDLIGACNPCSSLVCPLRAVRRTPPTLHVPAKEGGTISMAGSALKKPKKRRIVGGVDTHGDTHHAAVVLLNGTRVADAEFEATAAGYTLLLAWLRSFGRLFAVGVEGTGAYGAGLARHLGAAG